VNQAASGRGQLIERAFVSLADTFAILQERAIRRAEILNEQLQVALTSRVIIEQAKGVLAQHATLSMDRAFDPMRRYAHASNERLSDVARAITERTLDPNACPGPVQAAVGHQRPIAGHP
jgi:AmiR/NasT family two-component response regulator